jgi:hypothetical protein
MGLLVFCRKWFAFSPEPYQREGDASITLNPWKEYPSHIGYGKPAESVPQAFPLGISGSRRQEKRDRYQRDPVVLIVIDASSGKKVGAEIHAGRLKAESRILDSAARRFPQIVVPGGAEDQGNLVAAGSHPTGVLSSSSPSSADFCREQTRDKRIADRTSRVHCG